MNVCPNSAARCSSPAACSWRWDCFSPSEGAFPGYTFIDTGAEGGPYVAIGPRQGAEDEVLFFVGVEDVAATLTKAEELGGKIIQPAQQVPGTTFGVLADVHGHKVGIAANG